MIFLLPCVANPKGSIGTTRRCVLSRGPLALADGCQGGGIAPADFTSASKHSGHHPNFCSASTVAIYPLRKSLGAVALARLGSGRAKNCDPSHIRLMPE